MKVDKVKSSSTRIPVGSYPTAFGRANRLNLVLKDLDVNQGISDGNIRNDPEISSFLSRNLLF